MLIASYPDQAEMWKLCDQCRKQINEPFNMLIFKNTPYPDQQARRDVLLDSSEGENIDTVSDNMDFLFWDDGTKEPVIMVAITDNCINTTKGKTSHDFEVEFLNREYPSGMKDSPVSIDDNGFLMPCS